MTKLWILILSLGLLALFFLCPWRHSAEIEAMLKAQSGAGNTAANANRPANMNTAATAPASFKVLFENGKYRLTGTLPDDAAKQQILAKAKEVYGDGNFIDELKVGGVAKPGWLAAAIGLMPFTKTGVKAGGLSAEGNSLTLTGEVASQAEKDKIYADAVKANPGVTINNLLTVAGQKAMTEEQAKVQAKLNEALAGKIVEFETASDKLTDKGKATLDELAPIIKGTADNLEVSGHTDNAGKPQANQLLSERRARTVVAYLSEKGIDAKRMTPKGYGQNKPIADNATPEGKQRNRRIDFQVIGGGK